MVYLSMEFIWKVSLKDEISTAKGIAMIIQRLFKVFIAWLLKYPENFEIPQN